MYACSGVTCHLYFWQNDRRVLRATAVTRGWNGHRIRVSTGEENSPAAPAGIQTRNLSITSPARTKKLSHLPRIYRSFGENRPDFWKCRKSIRDDKVAAEQSKYKNNTNNKTNKNFMDTENGPGFSKCRNSIRGDEVAYIERNKHKNNKNKNNQNSTDTERLW